MKIKINRNCLLKIFLEEFKSEEVPIISISLQIARVPLLFYALFLSVNANEKMICICIIWSQLHMWDDVLCINLPASFLSALHIWRAGRKFWRRRFYPITMNTLEVRSFFKIITTTKWWNWLGLWKPVHSSLTNPSTLKNQHCFGQVFVWQLDCMFYHYLQDLTSVHSTHKKRTPWVTISSESIW